MTYSLGWNDLTKIYVSHLVQCRLLGGQGLQTFDRTLEYIASRTVVRSIAKLWQSMYGMLWRMLGWWVTKFGAISIKYKIILSRWYVIDRVFAWFKYPMSKCVPRSFLSFVIMNMFQSGQFYLATSWVVPQNKVAWILLKLVPFGNARSCEVLWPWKMFVRCFLNVQ